MTVKRVSKRDADYTPNGTWTRRCGLCRYFTAPLTCALVAGPVALYGKCKLWEQKGWLR